MRGPATAWGLSGGVPSSPSTSDTSPASDAGGRPGACDSPNARLAAAGAPANRSASPCRATSRNPCAAIAVRTVATCAAVG